MYRLNKERLLFIKRYVFIVIDLYLFFEKKNVFVFKIYGDIINLSLII